MKITSLSPNAESIDEDTGEIALSAFADALQVWAWAQDCSISVEDAALAFNATPEVIREAVEWHPWMFLEGDMIAHEGD